MKTQTNYKNCKNIWNFDQNALFNRFLLHYRAPGRPKITSRNQKRYKIFCILSTITYGTRKTPTFHKQWKMCKNRKPLYIQRSKWDSFLHQNGTLISFWEEFTTVKIKHKKKQLFRGVFFCKKRWRRKLSTTKSTNQLSNTNCSISRKVIFQKHQKLGKIARFWASKCGRD